MGKTPRVQTASEPIRELVKIREPVGQRDTAGTPINPATEDTLAAQPDFAPGQTIVDTTAVQLTVTSIPCKKGVLIKALSTNAGIVYIGKSGVTADTGYELTPGETVDFEIDDVSKVFAIASAAGQRVCWIGV